MGQTPCDAHTRFDFFSCDSYKLAFSPLLHSSCVWKNDWQAGSTCLHVAVPCQIFQREEEGKGEEEENTPSWLRIKPQTSAWVLPFFTALQQHFSFGLWNPLSWCLTSVNSSRVWPSSPRGPLADEPSPHLYSCRRLSVHKAAERWWFWISCIVCSS